MHEKMHNTDLNYYCINYNMAVSLFAQPTTKTARENRLNLSARFSTYFENPSGTRELYGALVPSHLASCVIDQLRKTPQRKRESFMWEVSGLLNLKQDISERMLRSIFQATESLSPEYRGGFLEGCVFEVLKSKPDIGEMEFGALLGRISLFRGFQEHGFLPPEMLSFVSCGRLRHTCPETAQMFEKAFSRGTLIMAPAQVDGKAKILLVKGFFGGSCYHYDTGKQLAFEPDSGNFYAVKIQGGTIVETERRGVFLVGVRDNLLEEMADAMRNSAGLPSL
jgi:hypothetical protein